MTEVLGDEAPLGVTAVRARNVKTGATRDIPCAGFFVAIGHAPASELVKDQLPLHNGGYVVVEPGIDPHRDPRRLRGGRPDRPRLPAGRDQRRHGLHGGA